MRKILLIIVGMVSVLSACTEIHIQPSQLTLSSDRSSEYVLDKAVESSPVNGWSVHLISGSKWIDLGSTDQGEVFKPVNTVVNVPGVENFEGYIVVRSGIWVGFWLPYEKAFSPLTQQIPITLKREDRK